MWRLKQMLFKRLAIASKPHMERANVANCHLCVPHMPERSDSCHWEEGREPDDARRRAESQVHGAGFGGWVRGGNHVLAKFGALGSSVGAAAFAFGLFYSTISTPYL